MMCLKEKNGQEKQLISMQLGSVSDLCHCLRITLQPDKIGQFTSKWTGLHFLYAALQYFISININSLPVTYRMV